jgi:PBP4 family serine-type D-alanyl-D-alanine carboxypeptidase
MKKASKAVLSIVPEFGAERAVVRYLVGGNWSGDQLSQKLPVPETKAWFESSLLKEFSRQGLTVQGADDLSEPEASVAARESLRIESDPLADLERYMNKESDNFLADAIFKAVAVREKDKVSDLREVAVSSLKESLTTWMRNQGHPEYVDEVHLIDGAGLSRSNRVTPRAFLALLKEFSKHPSFNVLWDSLPIAGVDGTLKNRMKKTAAEGIARAKTGTLRGAYQLAGYIPLGDPQSPREFVPFVLLSAATAKEKDEVRAFQDKLVAKVTAKLRE